MLKKICAAVGGFVIRSCHDTGRIMQLFLDTAARLKNADARETIRQMSRLGADSLPIVLMTILFTGMVFALQTATEFVRFGAASSVGGIVAIGTWARACARAYRRGCCRAHRCSHSGGAWYHEGNRTD